MKVGRLFVLLSGATLGIVPGSILAVRLASEPVSDAEIDLQLRCYGPSDTSPTKAVPCPGRDPIPSRPHRAEPMEKETLLYALAVNPRHRLLKPGARASTASDRSRPTKSLRDKERPDRACNRARPDVPLDNDIHQSLPPRMEPAPGDP